MKSLMLLWSQLAIDSASWCCTSALRDIQTVSKRFEYEGESFFTITLPQFGKDVELCLDRGCVTRQDFQGFKRKSGLPAFLRGFLELVFEPTSGRLLDDPDIEAIRAVRQLTLLYSKMFRGASERRERAAMLGYVECEKEVQIFDENFSQEQRDQFSRVSNIVLGRALLRMERVIRSPENLMPGHGPGSTADRLLGNQKWSQMAWTERLEGYFPSVDYLLPSASYWEDLDGVHFLEPGAEPPVRVISVPKTQKTPRIIAAEPTHMMYVQQALKRVIYEEVARDDILNTFIGFEDQTPNQELARIGSGTGTLATLDLSEASDRVSYEHVRELLRFNPSFLEAISACRSQKARVPGVDDVLNLSKFASMGSALSFPVEAMVFLTIVFVGYENALNRQLTRSDVLSLMGSVRIFGDDIIVPVDLVRPVVEALESFGMRVNSHKSFWTGRFRESCGKEYFDGQDVSIVKARQMLPTSREDVTEIIAWVDTSNQFFGAGRWLTVRWLDGVMGRILRDYPVVLPTSPVLGRHSFMGYQAQKTGGRYQVPLVKGYLERSVSPVNPLGEHHALRKWFLLRGEKPITDESHLERSGRPAFVSIKRGWAKPF